MLLGRGRDGRPVLAKGVEEFIDYVLAHFECYWLTTHCKGDAGTALDYLRPFASEKLICQLAKIHPTDFRTWKTEAIDLSSDFYWLDDYLFNAEIDVLKENGKFSSWINVNSYVVEKALLKCIELLIS